MHPDDEKVLSRIDSTIDGLTADRDRLREENKRLRAALENFANMDSVDLGKASLNNVRDDFMYDCPEYVGYCKQARAALAQSAQEQKS